MDGKGLGHWYTLGILGPDHNISSKHANLKGKQIIQPFPSKITLLFISYGNVSFVRTFSRRKKLGFVQHTDSFCLFWELQITVNFVESRRIL